MPVSDGVPPYRVVYMGHDGTSKCYAVMDSEDRIVHRESRSAFGGTNERRCQLWIDTRMPPRKPWWVRVLEWV